MAINIARLPIDYFPDPTKGRPVFNGKVFIGEPDKDPEILANRKSVTLRQEDGTDVPITGPGQPLLTGNGGVVLYNDSPVQVLVDGNYSIKVLNAQGSQVYFVENALSSGTSDNISHDAGGTGSVPTTVGEELRRSISVDSYGADPTGVLDSTLSIRNAILHAVANNIPRVVGQGTYKVDLSAYINDSFAAFSSVNGLVVDFSAATINDVTAYSTTVTETVKFIHPTDCTGIRFVGKWNATVKSVIPATTPRDLGAFIMFCENQCYDCSVVGDLDGAYNGLTAFRTGASDPLVTKGARLNANITVSGVHYPYQLQQNGDDSVGIVNGRTTGRSHFVYGVDQIKIFDNCSNTLKQALIDTFEGNETSNVTVYLTDTNSTDGFSAALRMGLRFGDATPSKLTNIRYVLNVVGQAGSADFGHILEIGKFDNAGDPDTVQRGHELKGLIIEGVMDTTLQSSKKPIVQAGQLTGTDVVSGLEFKNLTPIGGTSTLVLDTYSGGLMLSNVNAGAFAFEMVNAQGTLTAIGSTAERFTAASTDTSNHTYIDCTIANAGGNQSIGVEKVFVRTMVSGFMHSNVDSTFNPYATKILTGDLTPKVNAFKVPAGSQISGTITYQVIADQSEFDTGSRIETRGKKSFSAVIDGSGNWGLIISFADEVVERKSAPGGVATVVFSLLDGDSTGGFIQVAIGGGYNIANSRAVLRLDMLSWLPVAVNEA